MEKNDSTPVQRKSLADHVYERLLDSIINGELVSGDSLSEVKLAESYEVSRTPVREALQRLASEGLIKNENNRRSSVVTISRRSIIEIFEIRQFLEAGAIGLAIDRIDSSVLESLRMEANSSEPTADAESKERALQFDAHLHETIAAHCGNSLLKKEIDRYSYFVQIMQRLAGQQLARLQLAYQQHLEILTTLEAADRPAAQRAIANHIASALQVILNDIYPDK